MRNSVVTALLSTLIRPSTLSAYSVHTRSYRALVNVGRSRSISSRTNTKSIPSSTITMASKAEPATTTGSATLPSLSGKIQRTLDPCVVLMKDMIGQYSADWKDRGGIFSLAQGVVYWSPPESCTTALQKAVTAPAEDSMLHMYGPDEGMEGLRDTLLNKLKDENNLADHEVMVTVGANQAYMNVVLTCLQDTDKCVVFAPYYFNHLMALQMTLPDAGAGADNILTGPSSDQGVPDLTWLREQLRADSSINMVTLTNPGNPTGVTLDRSVLEEAVEMCREYNCWLVLDGTYEYFTANGQPFDGCFTDPHVIHIFSLSKSYALAGYRCGYVVVSKQSGGLFAEMLKVQDTIPIAPSRISQVAAAGALSAGSAWVREKVATLDVGRQAILEALSPLPIMGGSGAMYVMAKLPSGGSATTDTPIDDVQIARELVRDYGVAVIPGTFCGVPGWIRVCYANLPPEKCLEAAARLRAGIQALTDR
jgi:aspartate/methionine/tyrosine aminotransferase